MQNNDILTRITSLYEYQTSPVVLCMKNSVIAPEWQVYVGSIPHLWLCACKAATLGPDLQVCMGPRPHLWFWAHITAFLALENQDYTGSTHHLWFCACKGASLGTEIQVSVGPRPNLWFWHAKERLLHQIDKSQCVPVMTCGFASNRATFGQELQLSMGSRHHLSFSACNTAWLAPE